MMKNAPFKGRIKLTADSSFRKLARALRRGKVPSERMGVIDHAMARAAKRRDVYLNSSPAKREFDRRAFAEWHAKRVASR